ncbi:MAG: YggS family pyridoxal phosphate-dependent enzyme [Deltaproteobacteria bacterium]
MLEQRLHDVRSRVAQAALRAGRSPEDVRILAVTKGVSAATIREAMDLGQRLFGENYLQEALLKREDLGEASQNGEWHFIGRLQKNKVRRVCESFSYIQSVDDLRLFEAIDRVSKEMGRVMPVFLQINVGHEASKGGILPEDLPVFLEKSKRFGSVAIRGLMAIPPFSEDPEDARGWFRALRELRDRMNDLGRLTCPLTELSMGMSHDFEVAIEEGATVVRIGTALFGPRIPRQEV